MKQVTFTTQTRGLGAVYNAGDVAVFDDKTADEIVEKKLGTAQAVAASVDAAAIPAPGVTSTVQIGATGGTAPLDPQGVAPTPEEVGTSGPGPAAPGVDEPGTPVPDAVRSTRSRS